MLRIVHIVTATLFIAVCLLAMAGCQASASARNDVTRELSIDDNGRPHYVEHVFTNSASSAPGPTSQPTVAIADNNGANAAASGNQQIPVAAYINRNRDLIFYSLSALLFVAGVLAFIFVGKVVGACVIASSFLIALMPKFLDIAGGYIIVAVLLALGGAAVWFVAQLYHSRTQLKSGLASWFKLASQGRYDEAGAALREVPVAQSVITQTKVNAAKTSAPEVAVTPVAQAVVPIEPAPPDPE